MRSVILSYLLFSSLMLVGCGDDDRAPDIVSSRQGLDKAIEASQTKDSQAVIANLTPEVLRFLSPDQFDEALNLRAQAHARSGNIDAAMADIEILKQGAADMANVYRTMSYVLLKKGDKAAAKKALSMAKRLNPRLKPIRD